MKTKIFITTLCLLCGLAIATAQTAKQELSAGIFGGMQGITASVNNDGKATAGFGFGGGIGYAFNFNSHWAVATGIDFGHYGSTLAYDKIESHYADNGVRFDYQMTNYEEKIAALLLEIPVMVRYSLPVGQNRHAIRFAAGVKLGVPMSKKYTASAEEFNTSQVIIDYDDPNGPYLFNNPPVALPEQKGDFDAALSVMVALEAAYRLPLSEKMGLSLGVFFHYGLNNMQSKNDRILITYSTDDSDLGHRPPQYSHNGTALHTGLVSAFRPMAIGLKLRFDIGF
jgi:hypothetical protein